MDFLAKQTGFYKKNELLLALYITEKPKDEHKNHDRRDTSAAPFPRRDSGDNSS